MFVSFFFNKKLILFLFISKSTFCLQVAYRVTAKEMFDNSCSRLKDAAAMDGLLYYSAWRNLATSKSTKHHYISDRRRSRTNWEKLEAAMNELLWDLSVTGRTGTISIALDDDKVWFSNTGENASDRFGLKYTTHVRDNRKGIIAHTAVSAVLGFPLAVAFEKKEDSSISCFKRMLSFLFGKSDDNDLPDLTNVLIGSDRGYLVPSLVFGFILEAGGASLEQVLRVPRNPLIFLLHCSGTRGFLQT